MIQELGNNGEDAKNVYQRPTRTKEQTEKNNWDRSTGKWPGGQNGGNHCCRTEYRKKNEKKWRSLRDLWDSIKCTNIHILGVPQRKKRDKGPEKIFEVIIAEKLPNMEKEIVNQ